MYFLVIKQTVILTARGNFRQVEKAVILALIAFVRWVLFEKEQKTDCSINHWLSCHFQHQTNESFWNVVSGNLVFVGAKSGCLLSSNANFTKIVFDYNVIMTSPIPLWHSPRGGNPSCQVWCLYLKQFQRSKNRHTDRNTDRIALYILDV